MINQSINQLNIPCDDHTANLPNSVFVNNLNIIHQNIRSMRENFDTLCSHLSCMNCLPAIIFLSEIWIYKSECDHFSLDEYNLIANCNESYRAGGVAVFVKKNVQTYSCMCLNLSSADVIVLNVKIDSKKLHLCAFIDFMVTVKYFFQN